ncbi:MAG: preprotein translocase subunit SecG [Flavobacteriales bacterium]|nr:preprotein translocase subunit SecG [Flavobacteriales bacterium]MCB0818455.1 preprotein translocase subunit SecG [Flavobacteriales bacterium]HOP42471.1 preprotein translocase subunit SecG [Flavobacteriales bacterium]HPF67117.1 preprotein translocase subunit SecG [Flavobacteriales bacterium]HRW89025.1 preprotein translocase subunit SecG [Flavobacteriales bacterium]
MVAISILILIVCFLLALVVLAQNPKGGGLAAGFTGAQQIGGVQRTADFLEKSSWTLAVALMVLCLIASSIKPEASDLASELDAPSAPVTEGAVDPGAVSTENPEEAASEALKSLEDEEETN